MRNMARFLEFKKSENEPSEPPNEMSFNGESSSKNETKINVLINNKENKDLLYKVMKELLNFKVDLNAINLFLLA